MRYAKSVLTNKGSWLSTALIAICVAAISASVWAVRYEYDDLDRLTTVIYDNGKAIGYSYDAVGNSTEKMLGAKGDLNANGDYDLFDVLRVIDIILDIPPQPSPWELWAGDMDNDGDVDLYDVLAVIDRVLET